jgi:oxalate decarboxylase/phosphoglucose isomerase-like protein (cupin superfamily)
MTIDDCRIIEFPRFVDPEGSLTPIEGGRHIPFDIKRVFYIYDVPTAESRGAHAHKELQQVLICLSGSFNVLLDDTERRCEIRMNRPWRGLYVPPMIWAAIVNFDPGSVCLVLASELYSEADYYRDYQEYLRAKRLEDGGIIS